jgi:hypothetical protein
MYGLDTVIQLTTNRTISLTQQFLNRLLINQPDFIQFLRHGLQLTTSQTLPLPITNYQSN